MMVLDHVGDLKVFDHNMLIAFSIGFRRLEMMVTPLASNLQVGLGDVLSRFTASVAALLTTAKRTLFASKRLLRGAIEAGVLHRLPFAVGQEGLQAHINANIGMAAGVSSVFRLRFSL